MQKAIAFFILLFAGGLAFSQTKSDSLYFSKLYALRGGKFLLIGSETKGSFRKAVIRMYDQQLKMISQRYEKNMRNSDVYLDEIYPDKLRAISRYRWNRGRVFMYSMELSLQSVRFFKRDDYKDWNIKTDEPADYPLRGEENLWGLDPIYYKDSLCYFFHKENKTIFISTVNATWIKPVYLPVGSFAISDKGKVASYKFLATADNRILFYYSLISGGERKNFFAFVPLRRTNEYLRSYPLDLPESTDAHYVSDIAWNADESTIAIAGSYAPMPDSKERIIAQKQTMQGYFLKAFHLDEESLEMTEVLNVKQPADEEEKSDPDGVIGFKASHLGFSGKQLIAVFEKFRIEERKVDMNNGMELQGNYFTYYSESLKVINYEMDMVTSHLYDFPLKYDLTGEKEFHDKHWRTLHDLKGQGTVSLLFNGVSVYGYNDMNVVHTDLTRKKTVYADRNYNYFLCDWSGEEPKYSLLLKNNKYRCYFFDNYFVRYKVTDHGFELRRFAY